MFTSRPKPPTWRKPSAYAESHCMKCAGGWVRKGKDGMLIVCLLDRDPILPDMIDCDRFEQKEASGT